MWGGGASDPFLPGAGGGVVNGYCCWGPAAPLVDPACGGESVALGQLCLLAVVGWTLLSLVGMPDRQGESESEELTKNSSEKTMNMLDK